MEALSAAAIFAVATVCVPSTGYAQVRPLTHEELAHPQYQTVENLVSLAENRRYFNDCEGYDLILLRLLAISQGLGGPKFSSRDAAKAKSAYDRLSTQPPQRCPPPDTPVVVFSASGGASQLRVSSISGGTQFVGTEVAIVDSDGTLTGGFGQASLNIPIQNLPLFVGLPVDTFTISGRFEQVSGSSSGFVPSAGNPVAFTNLFPNPATGSTGILLGAIGQNVVIDTEVDHFDFYAGFSRGLLTAGGPALLADAPLVNNIVVGLGLRGGVRRREDNILQSTVLFSDFLRQQINVDVQTVFVGPQISAGVGRAPAGGSGVFWSVNGYLAPTVTFTDARFSQSTLCTLCPLAGDRDYRLNSDISDTGFSLIAGGGFSVGFRFSPGTSLAAYASYEYVGQVGTGFVPITPSQQPPRIENDSISAGRFGVRFVSTFGQDLSQRLRSTATASVGF